MAGPWQSDKHGSPERRRARFDSRPARGMCLARLSPARVVRLGRARRTSYRTAGHGSSPAKSRRMFLAAGPPERRRGGRLGCPWEKESGPCTEAAFLATLTMPGTAGPPERRPGGDILPHEDARLGVEPKKKPFHGQFEPGILPHGCRALRCGPLRSSKIRTALARKRAGRRKREREREKEGGSGRESVQELSLVHDDSES